VPPRSTGKKRKKVERNEKKNEDEGDPSLGFNSCASSQDRFSSDIKPLSVGCNLERPCPTGNLYLVMEFTVRLTYVHYVQYSSKEWWLKFQYFIRIFQLFFRQLDIIHCL